MMSKKHKLFLLPLLILLSACSSPKISNIQSKFIDNNPQNYKTVVKTDINITTHSDVEHNPMNQMFDNVTITYYDKNSNVITKESTSTIKNAIQQNKNGMTLVQNKGKGTNITYTAEIDKNKTEERTYNVPFIAEFNKKEIKTESDLKHQINKNKPKDKFDWTGSSNNKINSIIITHLEPFDEQQHKYVYNYSSGKYAWKWVTVHREHVHEHTYEYKDGKLHLIATNSYDRDR